MPFNERVFQNQRLKFGIHHDDIKIFHIGHHRRYFGQMLPVEIAGHPILQFFGLAYVNDLAGLVQHQIYPWQ